MGIDVGDLADKIRYYKQANKAGWASVFGRLLVDCLDPVRTPSLSGASMVLANPTHVRRNPRHSELVVQRAEEQDLLSLVDWQAYGLAKLTETSKSKGRNLVGKRQAADELEQSLYLRPWLTVAGKHVVVYDDICTTGYQLDAVARFLKSKGATRVDGLVLARHGW